MPNLTKLFASVAICAMTAGIAQADDAKAPAAAADAAKSETAAKPRTDSPQGIEKALEFAIITAPEKRDPGLVKKLDAVAGRVLTA